MPDDSQEEHKQQAEIRPEVTQPPKGWQRWKWLGPGILWALSSAGAGEIFYSPRVGARYGFAFLWALIIVVFLAWTIIREIGRYTVVSGKTILQGYHEIPGPKNWPVWIFLVAQTIHMVTNTAGQAALAGYVLTLVFPGSLVLYTSILIVIATALIVTGGYSRLNLVSSLIAGALLVAGLVTLAGSFPPLGKLAAGLVPQIPAHFDLYFVLPWLGFLLIHGSAWYSYWVGRHGFAGGIESGVTQTGKTKTGQNVKQGRRTGALHSWVRLMSESGLFGTLLAGIFAIIFYILGAQLLGGQGLSLQGFQVGKQLAQALSSRWGAVGLWLFVVTAGGSFWTTALDGEDGASRVMADATRILFPAFRGTGDRKKDGQPFKPGWRVWSWLWAELTTEKGLRVFYVIFLGMLIPIAVLIIFSSSPLAVLSVAGILGAFIAPIFSFVTLWLNKRSLPKSLQPHWYSVAGVVLAGLFYTSAAVLYLLQLVGIRLF